ncbi:hypothetical protein [Catenulispora sp. GP43]|uniref:DUF7919 family protein n=1 Tax=Catenulispora sp. GP43 TaxID=3156263 RepID=UPI003512B66F
MPFRIVEPTGPRLNIGWLGDRGRFGRRKPFATGPVSDDVIDAVIDVTEAQAVNVTRGFHRCGYCPSGGADGLLRFLHRGRTVLLGNGEIRVPAADGSVFAAPTLIGHYIRDHHYSPPVVFTDGLLAFRHATADLAEGWSAGSPK